MNESPQTVNRAAGQRLAPVSLLAAFLENEAAIEEECAALEKRPDGYHPDDKIGLPYQRDIVRLIRAEAEKAQAANAPSERPANARTEPPTKRLQRALNGCVWSPWALFTGYCGVTPPPQAEITREEWDWMWAAVTKQQNAGTERRRDELQGDE